MAYGHFKSESRAARRGNLAQFRGVLGVVMLRPVKSQKGGAIRTGGELKLNRHWKGAVWAGGMPVTPNTKLTRY